MTDTNALTETERLTATSQAPDRFEDYALPEPLTRAIDDLGFGQVEDGAVRVMVEIRGDQRHVVGAKDPFEVSSGCC